MPPSLARRAMYSLIPVVVLLVGAEAGLRAAGWPTVTAAFEHNEPFWVTDPDLRDKPFEHKEASTTFPVSTNVDGLRAPLHAAEKPDGKHRVMSLGCSTTFGWGVADDESYPAVVERLAAEAGHDQVQVINGGQPGYTSFQGRWLWDEVLRYYEPDVVLIGFIVQDARTAAYSDRSQALLQQDYRYLKDHILYRSKVYLALRAVLGGAQIEAKERPDGQEGTFRVPPEDYVANLRTLVAGAQDVGATPVLFGYPLEVAGYTADHRRILAAAAQELDVPLLDPQDRMAQAAREGSLYFARDRGHANAAGNALIGQWVYEFLDSSALLGAK